MPLRKLGKTGFPVRALGLGGQALLEIEGQAKASRDLINKALDLGLNYFDTAPMYGPSRQYLGDTLKTRRNEIILASKLYQRDRSGAQKELDSSFKLLNTSYIDILQIHAIKDEEDLGVFKKYGAFQVMLDAKKADKVRFLGITGHYDPDMLIRFMGEYDFDTVLLPVNPAVPEFNKAIVEARKRDMGVIGMKVMSRGILPMYFDHRAILGYALQKADVSIIGCSTETDLEKNVFGITNPIFTPLKITPEIRERAAFFFKGSDKGPWPNTYQPDLPKIQYEAKK